MSKHDNILILAVVIIAALWLAFSMYRVFFVDEEMNINFEVTGISGDVDADSLVSLHKECIEFCVNRLYNMPGWFNECFEQCASLGKEVC